jgi:hypothetical protein
MIWVDKFENHSARDHGTLPGWVWSIAVALHRAAGLLDPWPGYAVSADDLATMLEAESRASGQPFPARMRLDELLERHRRILAGPARKVLSGEWLS